MIYKYKSATNRKVSKRTEALKLIKNHYDLKSDD